MDNVCREAILKYYKGTEFSNNNILKRDIIINSFKEI